MDTVIRKAIEAKLTRDGLTWVRLKSFRLDSDSRSVTLSVDLDGEPAPVDVTIRYAVDGNDLVIEHLETSKRWLTEAARFGLLKQNSRIPLPTGLPGKIIRMVL